MRCRHGPGWSRRTTRRARGRAPAPTTVRPANAPDHQCTAPRLPTRTSHPPEPSDTHRTPDETGQLPPSPHPDRHRAHCVTAVLGSIFVLSQDEWSTKGCVHDQPSPTPPAPSKIKRMDTAAPDAPMIGAKSTTWWRGGPPSRPAESPARCQQPPAAPHAGAAGGAAQQTAHAGCRTRPGSAPATASRRRPTAANGALRRSRRAPARRTRRARLPGQSELDTSGDHRGVRVCSTRVIRGRNAGVRVA